MIAVKCLLFTTIRKWMAVYTGTWIILDVSECCYSNEELYLNAIGFLSYYWKKSLEIRHNLYNV